MNRRALIDGRNRLVVSLFVAVLALNGLGLIHANAAYAATAPSTSPTITFQSADGDQGGG